MVIELVKKILSQNNNEIQLFKAESHLRRGSFKIPSYQKDTKIILFIGVFHGDEPEGEPLILKLMNEVDKDPELIKNNQILFIPVLNPDGKAFNTRGNANGIDLNRNFPTKNWELSAIKDEFYSGESFASEVETKFLIEILDEFRPDAIITLHTPYRIVNFDGPAKELAHEISKFNDYPVQENIGYSTPGSFGTYAGIERNIPVITLELPDKTNIDTLWEENKEAFIYIVSL